MTKANMSMVTNEGLKIHCKALMTLFFAVVGLLVGLGTFIA